MVNDFFAILYTVTKYVGITIMTVMGTFMVPLISAAIVSTCLHALAGKDDADNTPCSNLCELAATLVGLVVFVSVAIFVFRWFPFI